MGVQNDIRYGETKHICYINHLRFDQYLERHLRAKSGALLSGVTGDGPYPKLEGHVPPEPLSGQRDRSADGWMTGKGKF